MINWRELQPHPINRFPEMQDWEFEELKQSIAEGYDDRMPIYVFKGDADEGAGIIDGVNRHKACVETGTIPLIKEFYGSYEAAMQFILRTNKRRNLTAGQKAAVVLDMDHIVSKLVEEAAARRDAFSPSSGTSSGTGDSRDRLGEMAGISGKTIDQAKKVKQHDPKLYEYVKAGKISAKSAYNQIQERIAKGDADLSAQRTAKSLLTNAIQAAINEAKDELFEEALKRVKSGGKNIKFKLKLTLN